MTRKRKRNPDRTMLLICCTREEAERIRSAAKREHRSISGFMINAVMARFGIEARLQERREQRGGDAAQGGGVGSHNIGDLK